MDTAIISAIIGAFATVLVAVLQLRKESNRQHGDLMRRLRTVQTVQEGIVDHLEEMKDDLRAHIESHETPKTAVKQVTAKKAAPKKSK